MKGRTGGAREIRGRFYARVRLGGNRRITVQLGTCTTLAAAEEQAAIIAEVAGVLVDVGRWFDVERIAKGIAAASSEKELRVLRRAATLLAASAAPIGPKEETFAGFASRWTSGQLHRDYPDHVPTKDARGDTGILALHVNPLVGHIPLATFGLEHADSVMRLVPSELSGARRRHIAQVVHRVLRLAVFPAKLIAMSPLPAGWLPKIGKGKALTHLYPDEDRTLLAAGAVDLDARLLYGFLCREGMRVSEAIALEWSDIDLERGAVNLDENKTDDPRAWALSPDVVTALAWWKSVTKLAGPFRGITGSHRAEKLRADLEVAGVTREALFERTAKRRPLRIHDLRATFITLSLANGRTESWVQDRTGHTSTLMIARYRRAARTVAELGLGNLTPLDLAIPEVSGGAQVGRKRPHTTGKKSAMNVRETSGGSPSRARTGMPFQAKDFKAGAAGSRAHKGRRNTATSHGTEGSREPDPQGTPHPTHGTPTWRSVAEVYEVFVAENQESDASDDLGPVHPLPTPAVLP